MKQGVRLGAVLGLAALALVGCTSSGGSKPSASVAAPSTSAVPSSTAASTTPTPTPTPTTSAPLSPFEQDPAVKALRAWAAQSGRTVNTGHYIDSALRALMTAAFAPSMKQIIGTDVGLYYPGPAPFTPISVRVLKSSERQVRVCVVSTGFAENKATKKPAKKDKVVPATATVTLSHGSWLLSSFAAGTFSCAGVRVPRPTW